MYKDVLVTVEKDIAYIKLNRPKNGNAITLNLTKELLKAAIYCDQNKFIRCVVLTAEGRFFCTGGDLDEFQAAGENISEFLSELAGILHLAISRLNRMNKPLLVAVNGTAADAGLTWYLPKIVGLRRAQEIIMTNKKMSANTALEYGLLTMIFSDADFEQRVKENATLLANQPLPALNSIRQLLLSSHQNSLETHLELEARAISAVSVDATVKEGVTAFLEKRRPDFKKV
ncbi:enoyl-CoA hydratase/isomerase family protein [Acinetobacter guillouiae]|uniref:enoyl-CoA hydratase/isomerase family protein n=1 Tax=Acinetobacter guillouiae TaxID=106649 RepID=UPI003AF82105